MRAALADAAKGHLWRVRAGWIPQPGGSLVTGPFHAAGTVKALIDRQLLRRGFDCARITERGRAVLEVMKRSDG